MYTVLLITTIFIIVVFLLAIIITIKKWYNPCIKIEEDMYGYKIVVLWYNHVVNKMIKRECKILFKI